MTIYQVRIGKRVYRVEVNSSGLHILSTDDNNNLESSTNNKKFSQQPLGRNIEVQKEKKGKKSSPPNKNAIGDIKAPMPGKIISIHVSEGDIVKEGQTIITIESMKMQMQLNSSIFGQVLKVNIHENDKIEKGALLVKIIPLI